MMRWFGILLMLVMAQACSEKPLAQPRAYWDLEPDQIRQRVQQAQSDAPGDPFAAEAAMLLAMYDQDSELVVETGMQLYSQLAYGMGSYQLFAVIDRHLGIIGRPWDAAALCQSAVRDGFLYDAASKPVSEIVAWEGLPECAHAEWPRILVRYIEKARGISTHQTQVDAAIGLALDHTAPVDRIRIRIAQLALSVGDAQRCQAALETLFKISFRDPEVQKIWRQCQ